MTVYALLLALLALTCLVVARVAVRTHSLERRKPSPSPSPSTSHDRGRVSSTASQSSSEGPLDPPRIGVIRPLEIHLFEGAGPIRFGMTPAEVRRILAEPEGDQSVIRGNDNGSLRFRGMVLWFWPESESGADEPPPESTLCRIELFDRPGATLFGRRLQDWTVDDLVRQLASMGLHATREDEYCTLTIGQEPLQFGFDRDGKLNYLDLERPEASGIRSA